MALTVKKWRFVDPYDTNPATNSYTFEINPNDETGVLPQRAIQSMTSTAPSGQVLLFEAATPAKEWSFSGTLLSKAQYDALSSWCYDRKRRIYIYDHFGRQITAVLTGVDMKPKRTQRHYWRHEYTVSCLVIKVGAATVGEYWS